MAVIEQGNYSLASFAKPTQHAWERNTQDIAGETRKQARYIGAVRLNNSRLNVFSTLKKGDAEDFFQFRNDSTGPMRIGLKNLRGEDDPYLRVELMDDRGRVLADSDPNNSELYQKFREYNEQGVQTKPGNFYLRISRNGKDPNTTELNYAAQVSMGDQVRHDYDTKEASYSGEIDPIQQAMFHATPPAYIYSYANNAQLLSDGLTALLEINMRNAQQKDLLGYAKVNFSSIFGPTTSIFGK